MRLVLVALSCLASLMTVQATSFVTVVKTVVEDRVVSISRRDEDDSLGDPSVTKICITSPATTCLDLTLTDGANPQDTKTEDPDDDDEDGWEDYTPPPTSTTKPTEQSSRSTMTIYTTASPSSYPARNTGPHVTHSKETEVYTEIPDWWPPTVGPGSDPYIEKPKIPEILCPDWTPTNKPQPDPSPYCSVYPLPENDSRCEWYLTPTQLIARATSA